jgi:hypothetical protein
MPSKPMDQALRLKRSITVADSGCWEWQRKKDAAGYGRLQVSMGSRTNIRWSSAHRYAYEVFVGAIPEGKCVLHRCDNRGCINPEHLFIGTQQDNVRDMDRKGRRTKGYKRDHEVCRQNSAKRRNHRNQHSAMRGGAE